MLTLTDAVKEKLRTHLATRPDQELAIRLAIVGRGKEGFRYDFRVVYRSACQPDDIAIDCDGFLMYIDPETAPLLEGAVLDLNPDNASFKIDNPNPVWTDSAGPQVLDVIERVINPGLAMHGGRIALVDVRDGVAYIAFGGGCQGCGMANVTLSESVHKLILEAVPAIHDVVDITEHALGTNPYFRPSQTGQPPAARRPN